MRPIVALAIVLGMAGGVSACGEEERAARATRVSASPPAPPPSSGKWLSERESFAMGVAKTSARMHCRRSRGTERRLREHVSALVSLARSKPDDLGSTYGEPARTPRGTLEDIVEELESHRCAPAVAQTAREAVQALPPGP